MEIELKIEINDKTPEHELLPRIYRENGMVTAIGRINGELHRASISGGDEISDNYILVFFYASRTLENHELMRRREDGSELMYREMIANVCGLNYQQDLEND